MTLRGLLRDGPGAWVGAGAVAVAWAGIFPLLWPPAPMPRPRVPPPVPAVAYLPVRAAAAESAIERPDIRTLWSPVLFSLPSAAGFSRAPSHAGGLKPPLDLPDEPLPVLSRASERTVNRPTVLAAVGNPDPAGVAARATAAPMTLPRAPVVERIAGTADLPAGADLPVPAARRGAKAWEAEATIEFDAGGLATHVFVERSEAEPAVTAELARGLYRWRVPTSAAASSLRVRFHHEPAVVAAPGGPRP